MKLIEFVLILLLPFTLNPFTYYLPFTLNPSTY